jgi:hypothetical protein
MGCIAAQALAPGAPPAAAMRSGSFRPGKKDPFSDLTAF